jgi:hypothetical protein
MNNIRSNVIGQFWQPSQIPEISSKSIVRDIDKDDPKFCSFQVERAPEI